MQLAKIQRDGKLVLLPDALNHLRGLNKGILVVAVFGGARSAKSTTANMLLGREAFGMSNTTDACTFGVWIDSRPLPDGRVLLIVDSEGMNKGDTSQHAKILGLVSLLASDGGVLIDNEMKDLGEHNLGTLGVLATMNQMLRGTQKYSWPALIVLLRDFTLTLKVAKRPATPLQYLNHVLENPGDKVDETRKLIKDCFTHLNLFTFPPPNDQERQSLLNLPPGPFKNSFEALKTYLFDSLVSKTIMDVECTGPQLVDLLETCLDGLNRDDGVDIPNAHDLVVERFCKRLVVQLDAKYAEEIPKTSLTGEEAKLQEKHTSVRTALLASFDESTSGFTTDRVKQNRDDLEDRINKSYKLLQAENKLIEHQQKVTQLQEQQKAAQLTEEQKKAARKKALLEPKHYAPPPQNNRFINRPITYTSPPLRHDAAAAIDRLQRHQDELDDKLDEIMQNLQPTQWSPSPIASYPISPSVVVSPATQILSPQLIAPSPQIVMSSSPQPVYYMPQTLSSQRRSAEHISNNYVPRRRLSRSDESRHEGPIYNTDARGHAGEYAREHEYAGEGELEELEEPHEPDVTDNVDANPDRMHQPLAGFGKHRVAQ